MINCTQICQNSDEAINHDDDDRDLDEDDGDDVEPVRTPATDEAANHEAKHVSTASKGNLMMVVVMSVVVMVMVEVHPRQTCKHCQ